MKKYEENVYVIKSKNGKIKNFMEKERKNWMMEWINKYNLKKKISEKWVMNQSHYLVKEKKEK